MTITISPYSSLIFTQNVQQELKEALDALGFNSNASASTSSGNDDKIAGGRGTSCGVEGFASATFPELALLCRWVR